MATFKRALKIPARPQIKAGKQPIPRQVIVPKKAQPVVAENMPVQRTSVVPQNVPLQPATLANTVAQIPSPMANYVAGEDLQSLYQRIQNQFTNPTNPLYYRNPQTYEPAKAPVPVGFESYGFDKGLVDYLNNQREKSSFDMGVSYNYDPVTQTFKGQAMGGPVTKTLAEIQTEAQNYANRPVFNPNNPPVAAQAGAMPYPSTQMPIQGGFGQPLVPYAPNVPVYQNTQPSSGIQQMQNQLGMQPQQDFGGMSTMNTQGLGGIGQSPYQANPMVAGMGSGMATPYNSGNPMGSTNMAQPFNQTMPQTGFVPMGGYNPQNTSYGSFGAIQQPMGGFQNIGSLLGKG